MRNDRVKMNSIKIGNLQTFEWSLKPIIVWFNILGIPLNLNKSASEGLRFGLITYYSLCVFACFFAVQAFEIILVSTADDAPVFQRNNNFQSSTMKWNGVINFVNEKVIFLGTHIILMTYTLVKWKKLIRVLLRIEQFNIFNASTYHQFRSICWYGLGFAVVEMAFVFGIIAMSLWVTMGTIPIAGSLFYLVQLLSTIYPFSTAILIICFCKIVSVMISTLGGQNYFSKSKRNKVGLEKQIGHLKSSYLMIGEMVDKMNVCFGPVLLIFLTSTFVRLVNFLFFTSMMIKRNLSIGVIPVVSASLIILNISVVTFLLCKSASTIQRQIKKLTKRIDSLHFDDPHLQNQLEFFALRTIESPFKLTAVHLFDIDLRLIPTLVGTILTYLIILCQFQITEDV